MAMNILPHRGKKGSKLNIQFKLRNAYSL